MSKPAFTAATTDTTFDQTTSQATAIEYSNIIQPTTIAWQTDDTGNQVPVSGEFGDVYFSHADGLAEARHVFIAHNQLPQRLANLAPRQCFSIAELGFGTGLNLLATWELWRQLRAEYPQLATSRLHFITTEKHPIALNDLTQILTLWGQRAPELGALIAQLLNAYPVLIAGCHRLNFYADNLTVDLWLGDAADSLAKLNTTTTDQQGADIDAWFLDGFAPSCNESLWADAIFAQMSRLSKVGSSAATYSCAGVVKRGLKDSGFEIKKVTGFGRKREMLTALMAKKVASDNSLDEEDNTALFSNMDHSQYEPLSTTKPACSVVIGAGVAGLMTAWSLANRGINVTLLDKVAPLAGASGNPRALLAPKMTPIHHVDEHLHSIGYLYSNRLYRQLNDKAIKANGSPVLEPTGALDLLMKANINTQQIADYPDEMATTLPIAQAQQATNLVEQNLAENLYLPQSGLVNPQALKEVILAHPLITFQCLEVIQIGETETGVCITGHSNDMSSNQNADIISMTTATVIICSAYESHQLDSRIFDCRKIRGQLSWFTPTAAQWAKLPTVPLKYSGYCAPFTAQIGDAALNKVEEGERQLLLGASFVRNDITTEIRASEHHDNREKLIKAIPELEAIVPSDTWLWQARAGVRTQTPDYHPILGQLAVDSKIWTLSAMGAKGYAYAPICAEALADIILGNFAPLSTAMLARLAPDRARLQTPLI